MRTLFGAALCVVAVPVTIRVGSATSQSGMAANSKQRKAIEAELHRKRCWYYISFANSEGHLGSAIVRAHGELTAIQRCRELNIHPGNGPGIGDVVCMALGWRDMN